MTTYGTIPTEPDPTSNLHIISNAKERIKSSLGTRRSWKAMIQLHCLNFPTSFTECVQRIRTNAAFFRTNYVIIVLFLLFLSLLWHPISLIVYIIMMAAWLFLYFLRDQPMMILGLDVSDKIVMMFLLTTTIMLLFFANATDNIIIVALFKGVLVILVHGALRKSEDLIFVDDEGRFGSVSVLQPAVNATPVRLKNAASSSFSES